MSSEGYITDPTTGDVPLKDLAASKNFTIPKTSYSKAGYRLGKWGDNLATRLHESRYLYASYGALDGLSNICSHWRFLFDLIYNNADVSSDDKLHEFLASPEGMALAGIEAIAFVT